MDGRPVTKSQRPLVAALALWRHDGATIDELVDAIWPSRPPATARHSVQNQIARLRSSFGRELVLTTADHYRLAATTDVDVIDRLGASCDGGPVDRARADEICSVLTSWSGMPFADLPDHPVAHAQRARLHHVQSVLVETLALSRLTGSVEQLELAIVELTVRTSTEPLHERAWELLVVALHLAGRRTEALGAYAQFSTVLAAEVAAEPSRRFQRLRELVDADQPVDAGSLFSGAVAAFPPLRATG